MSSSTKIIRIKKIDLNNIVEQDDVLAVEEPLEIRLIYGADNTRITKSISITMRTPGNDIELAVGFLFTEGIINQPQQILNREIIAPTNNIINIELTPDTQIDFLKLERHFYTNSSCGVCGKSSIDAIHTIKPATQHLEKKQIDSSIIFELSTRLSKHQQVFQSTGALHASALFTIDGELVSVREDVGRHNALDKLIGEQFLNNQLPLSNHILLLSGRASFELVQKAAMANIGVICAIGAPSSLAVQLAQDFGITLIGFLRGQRFNIYC